MEDSLLYIIRDVHRWSPLLRTLRLRGTAALELTKENQRNRREERRGASERGESLNRRRSDREMGMTLVNKDICLIVCKSVAQ